MLMALHEHTIEMLVTMPTVMNEDMYDKIYDNPRKNIQFTNGGIKIYNK